MRDPSAKKPLLTMIDVDNGWLLLQRLGWLRGGLVAGHVQAYPVRKVALGERADRGRMAAEQAHQVKVNPTVTRSRILMAIV